MHCIGNQKFCINKRYSLFEEDHQHVKAFTKTHYQIQCGNLIN